MITIIIAKGKLQICGHARAAPEGKDIICAAVSTLVQSFVHSVEVLTGDLIESTIAAGDAVIEYGRLSEQGKLLRDSFILGVRDIAYSYPEHVLIQTLEDGTKR